MGRARDLANILSSSGSVALDSEMGLSLITPTSIAVTGGSGSISSSGNVSFTSASAISLNGVFSSTYNDYKIFYKVSPSVSNAQSITLRQSGSDSIVSYNGSYVNWFSNSTSVGNNQINNASFFRTESHQDGVNVFDLISPYLEERTKLVGTRTSWETSRSVQGLVLGMHNVLSSYDGITFAPVGGGVITGSIQVYGYRK